MQIFADKYVILGAKTTPKQFYSQLVLFTYFQGLS
jgi:hypothetical protein